MNTSVATGRGSASPAERRVMVIGFGQRLVATLLDGAILAFLSFILSIVVSVVPILIGWLIPIPANAFIIPCGLLLSVIYYTVSWTKSGQTAGKIAMGIKVVSQDGSRLSWGKALLRYVGYIVSALVASIGFLWVAFDGKRQGWHDKIAGTYVIRAEDKFSAADQVKFVPSDPERSWLWVIVWIAFAVFAPTGLFAGLWALGPFMSRALADLIR